MILFRIMDRIPILSLDSWVEDLPATGREDVFVFIIPSPINHLTRVRFVLLYTCISHESDIIMYIDQTLKVAGVTGGYQAQGTH